MPLCIVSNEHTPCMLTGEPMMIEKRTDINIDAVFNPITLGNIKIPNRFAMAPMTRSFSPGNVPDEKVAAYYRRRAEGGTGLIVTEGVGIDHPAAIGAGSGEEHLIPVLYGDKALAGWRHVVDEVHKAGGVIFPQLWHQGVFRVEGTGPFPEATSCRPSGIWGPPGRFSTVTPEYITRVIEPTRAMTESEIADVVASFARSAKNAQSVGFDGIAIHGASGYLIDSFLWPETNLRQDGYGGDAKARARFATEIDQEIGRAHV